jgi:hypothetical protein
VQLPAGAALPVLVTVTCGIGVGVAVLVTVTVTLGLTVTVTVWLGLAVPVVLLLTGGVLWTAGGVELFDFVTFCEAGACELVLDDEHVATAAGLLAPLDTWLADTPLADPGPEPLVPAEPDVELCEVKPSTELTIPWRIDGTAASITPTANTAKPTAKAGRSMASRQSRGRWACRGLAGLDRWAPGAVCPWRSAYQPRASAAFQRRIMSASTLTAAARPRVSRNLPALA